MPERFDAIVIGAGEAGTIVASRAVAAGFRVALIYKGPFGSTCLNSGCVPSKFMIHRARIAHLARTAARFHVRVTEPAVDLASIVREKNADIVRHRGESLERARRRRAVAHRRRGQLQLGAVTRRKPWKRSSRHETRRWAVTHGPSQNSGDRLLQSSVSGFS